MTESLSNQFLPGIDWRHYDESSGWVDPDPMPKPVNRVPDSSETAKVPLAGLSKVSDFYGDAQKNQQAEVLGKMQHVVDRRPLPEGFEFTHYASPYQPDFSNKHYLGLNDAEGKEVGRLSWNGDTGRVGWLGVDQEHRGLADHLITEAHRIAAEHGDVGPTHSEDLSNDSYQLVKRYASAFMPKNALIHGRTPEEQEAHTAYMKRLRERQSPAF
jgi:hypothetical protein